ncbi:hypothetical protein K439DRAFT_388606 [Ramaria rubella]|nr:hypothetical protein K439DRAFT_388606 [Ramaria rubella]
MNLFPLVFHVNSLDELARKETNACGEVSNGPIPRLTPNMFSLKQTVIYLFALASIVGVVGSPLVAAGPPSTSVESLVTSGADTALNAPSILTPQNTLVNGDIKATGPRELTATFTLINDTRIIAVIHDSTNTPLTVIGTAVLAFDSPLVPGRFSYRGTIESTTAKIFVLPGVVISWGTTSISKQILPLEGDVTVGLKTPLNI